MHYCRYGWVGGWVGGWMEEERVWVLYLGRVGLELNDQPTSSSFSFSSLCTGEKSPHRLVLLLFLLLLLLLLLLLF